MKKIVYFILPVAAAMLFASCAKEIHEASNNSDEPVYITASIDQATKATLSESAGKFAFSNGDELAVCNSGTTKYTGATTSTTNTATFAMTGGFDSKVDGIAGFPAGLVSAMTTSSVTFTLPTSYTYAEVGGDDPDVAKVPTPMMGTYTYNALTETGTVNLKHVGALIRFRLTNLKAGSVSFTFPTNVTGTYTLTEVPDDTGEGILDDVNFTSTTKTITVTGVPAVADGSYIYITLPVPTGTAPHDILVTNSDQMYAIGGSSSPLIRAGGWKLSARPDGLTTPEFSVGGGKKIAFAPGNLMAKISSYTSDKAVAGEWKFGEYFEYIGTSTTAGNYLFYVANSDDCIGKWVDVFQFQGASVKTNNPGNCAHGLIRKTAAETEWHGNGDNESAYDGCWNTGEGGITITNGEGYSWRPLTYAEMDYIFSTRTSTGTLNGVDDPRFARVKIAGVEGLLVFPDDFDEGKWYGGTMGSKPTSVNKSGSYVWGTDDYTSSQGLAMMNAGMIFLPNAGYFAAPSGVPTMREGQGTGEYTGGRYWTGTGSGTYRAYRVGVYDGNVMLINADRFYGMTVRLVRDITPKP